MKFFKLLFLFTALVGLSSFSNKSGSVVNADDTSTLMPTSQQYCIEGEDHIYTASPVTYIVRLVGGVISPDIKVTWSYSADLQSIGGSNNSVTLARKYAVGNYVLTATLSNGVVIYKSITAVDAYKP